MVLKKNAVKIGYNKYHRELYGNTANQGTSKSKVCQSKKHCSPFNHRAFHSDFFCFFVFLLPEMLFLHSIYKISPLTLKFSLEQIGCSWGFKVFSFCVFDVGQFQDARALCKVPESVLCEWLRYRAFKGRPGLQPPRGGYVRVFNENLHGTIGSVCEGEVPIRASSGWHTEEARKPDEQQVACMMLRVTSFLHIAFHFRSSLKSEHFSVRNIHSGSAAGQPCGSAACDSRIQFTHKLVKTAHALKWTA